MRASQLQKEFFVDLLRRPSVSTARVRPAGLQKNETTGIFVAKYLVNNTEVWRFVMSKGNPIKISLPGQRLGYFAAGEINCGGQIFRTDLPPRYDNGKVVVLDGVVQYSPSAAIGAIVIVGSLDLVGYEYLERESERVRI